MNAVLLGMVLAAAAGGTPAGSTCAQLVTPTDAARRAVALGFLSSRAWLELRLPKVNDPAALRELRRRRKELDRRANALQVGTVMSLSEHGMFRKELGTWERAQVATGSWAMEGAGTLLWVLRVAREPPAWSGPMSLDDALRPIMPAGAAESLLKKPQVRTPAEVGRLLAEARLFAWRLDAEVNRRAGGALQSDPLPADVTAHVRDAAATSVTTRVVGNDLLAGSSPVSRLPDRSLRTLRDAARARVDVLAWACGTH